ncbi:FtsH protease activity modulator HflK [bacterium]|nr:FtsH protease activity modulator HflK [bacterium]
MARMVNMSGKVVELPRFEGRWLRWIAIGAVVAWFLLSSFYTVDADEVGVIQRFGKYVETMQPGLHMKIPFGIETVKKVKVQRVLKEEFGYRTQAPGVRSTYDQGDFSSESLMLTGDLSCALVEWIVQYRIKDPKAYLFHVRDITGTIRDLTQSAMRQVVGDHSVDEVIITNRQEISLEVRDLLQQLLDHTETGVDIVTVNLQDVNPPGPVQPAFNAVNEAKQERERIINEALEAYNKVIPQAQGEAEQLLRQAEGYSVNRVNRARGDADKFLAIWQEYSRARDVTRRRMYLETMLEVMPRVKEVYIIDDKQSNLIPLLQLRGLEKGGQP